MAGTTRVLQVDDERDFLEMSAALLERADDAIEVVTAAGGEEALEVLDERGIDCVVSDYDMPGMDGLDLLRAVRERSPDIPFILLTARGSEAVASEAISAGVDDYLQKGGGDEQYQLLANRVRNLVRQAHAEASYREIFENAAVGLTVRDTETGELVDANERYCEMLGYEKAELLSLSFDDVSVTEEGFTRERALEHIHAAGEDAVETFEWLDRTNSGDRLWVEVNCRLAEIEGEQRVLSSVRDITERKSHERALDRTREYHETVAANLPGTAVAIYDTDLTYEFVDGGVFDDLDVDAADLEGAQFDAVHSDGFVERHRDDYAAAVAGESREFEYEHGDRTFRAHALPVTNEEDEIIAGMVVGRDVTRERERKRRLERVAALLTHGLRDPLSVAGGAVDRALEAGDTGHLADAREALDLMDDVVADAVAMTGPGDGPGTPDPVDVAAVARRAWGTVATDGAALEVGDVGRVRADEPGVRLLLENCFDTAVARGGADTVVVERTGDGFAVADDGTGVPADDREAALEGGVAADADSGLGLTVVDAVADAHGWSVAVEPSSDGGARLEVSGVERPE